MISAKTNGLSGRRRVTPTRVAVAPLLVLVLVYGAAMVWLVTDETRLVFQAGRPLAETRPSFPYEQVDLPRTSGGRQFAWVMRHLASRTWVLFLHGNSATIASRVNIARYRELHDLGLNVVAAEYRGFAGLAGVPSVMGLARMRASPSTTWSRLGRASGCMTRRLRQSGS